jgi:hypothetical protein
MRTGFLACVVLGLITLITFPPNSLGSPRVIDMHNAEGEPYKEAVRVLLRAMAKGDKDACAAAFVGQGDDLKLLEATIASNAAMTELRDAILSNVGDPGQGFKEGFVFADQMLRSIDVQTIVVDSNRPDAASISPGSFPSYGYEVVRRDGKWKVLSITGFPKDMPELLVVHPKLTDAFQKLTARVEAGEFKSTDNVIQAVRESIQPIMATFQERTKK